MILIVLENPANIIFSFTEEMKSKYPKSSIGFVSAKDKVTETVAKFSKPPLFTDSWLIECALKTKVSLFKKLGDGDNIVLLRVTSRKALDELIHDLKDCEIKVVDNYRPPESKVLTWIQNELKCNTYLAAMIYERCSGNFSQMINSVALLSMMPCVSEVEVKKYVTKIRTVGLNDIVQYLLGTQSRGVKFESVVKVVEDYQWALSFLVDFLANQLEIYIYVFKLAAVGNITLENYKQYRETCQDSKIAKLSDYQLKKILEAFGVVSLRYVCYMRSLLLELDTRSRLCIYRLINIIKLGAFL